MKKDDLRSRMKIGRRAIIVALSLCALLAFGDSICNAGAGDTEDKVKETADDADSRRFLTQETQET